MEKLIRNGKVAVLVSRGYGAGWSTWNDFKEMIYLPEVVKLVEEGRKEEITDSLIQVLLKTNDYVCTLGVDGLAIEWIPIGTSFIVEEYDGAESIRTLNNNTETA